MVTIRMLVAAISLASMVRVGAQTGQGQSTAAPLKSPVAVSGRASFICVGASEPLRATFYKTQPGLAVLQRGVETRIAFTVVSASGARYVGDDVSFWEAKGEATINWSGKEQRCKKDP